MLRTDIHIRLAKPHDATAISRVIVTALRETNSRDYAATLIERIAASYSPDYIARQLMERQILVASAASTYGEEEETQDDDEVGDIVGMVGLECGTLRSLFVDPLYHGAGIGTALLEEIEGLAMARGYSTLTVAASLTAEAFYRHRGYTVIRAAQNGSVRVILMRKELD